MSIPIAAAPLRPARFATTFLLLAVVIAGAAQGEPLRIGGTGAALGTAQLLADAFSKQNKDIDVEVLPSLGTSGAIKAVPKGALDIGLSARPLNEAEGKLGVVAFEYARTPLVFAVAKRSAVNGTTLLQLGAIYGGTMATWPGGEQVRPVLRQSGDDNTRQVMDMSPALAAAMPAAEARPGLPFATTDQEAADKMERIPGAIGVTTLGQISSESRALRPLTLDGIAPTAANGESGKYAHAKRLYLVTRTEPSASTKRFIAFVRSPPGKAILVRTGHWVP